MLDSPIGGPFDGGRQSVDRVDSFDISSYRQALGSFVTGVTVVATILNGRAAGFTANSFTSVSLAPPLVLVCIAKSSSSFPVFAAAGCFSVNILSEDQAHLSQTFAAKGVDRFASTAWRSGPLGSPIIGKAAAWFECSLQQGIDAGDHHILIGRVHSFDCSTARPLAYYRGGYVALGAKPEPCVTLRS